jgi:hypothetical protein
MNMASATAYPDALARDLVRLLTDLAGLHAEMAGHVREKLDAMRKADSERIAAITARELLLAEKVAEREGLRRQITRRIAEALGVQRAEAETMRVGELADRLSEPRRSQLITAATGLRQRLEELQRLQKTNALVTQAVLKHLSEIMGVMCVGGPAMESYTRGGRRARQCAASVFEAVG